MTMEDALEDELAFRFRMGRLSEADAKTFQALFEKWRLRRSAWGKFPGHRQKRYQLMEHRHNVIRRMARARGNGREAVFKNICTVSTWGRMEQLIDYLDRDVDKHDGRPFRDEYGEELTRDDAIAAPSGWPNYTDDIVIRDRDERSEGPAAHSAEDSIEMPVARRNSVLAYHLVFSMRRDKDDPEDAYVRFADAVDQTLDSLFVDDAYPLLWTVHDDGPEHLHAHVVLSAVSWHGRRMRFDRAGDHVDFIRLSFARNLTRAGIEHSATRREDRYDDLMAVLRGEQYLRTTPSLREGAGRPGFRKARRPEWFELTIPKAKQSTIKVVEMANDIPVEYRKLPPTKTTRKRKRFGSLFRRKAVDVPAPVRIPSPLQGVHDACSRIFLDATAATERIKAVIDGEDETKSLVIWRIARWPREFGALRFDGYIVREDLEQLVEKLRSVSADQLKPAQRIDANPNSKFPYYSENQRQDRRASIISYLRVATYWWQKDRQDIAKDIFRSLLDILGADHQARRERLGLFGKNIPMRDAEMFPGRGATRNGQDKPGRDFAKEIVSRAHPDRTIERIIENATPPRKGKRRRGIEM